MKAEEIIELAMSGDLAAAEGIDPSRAVQVGQYLAIDDLVVIPIAACSSSLDPSVDADLLDADGQSMGTVCFVRRLGTVTANELTRWQYAAYLHEVEKSNAGLPHEFQADYVVLELSRLGEYEARYKQGAPLWGGFTHSNLPSRGARSPGDFIDAVPDITLPTTFHQNILDRYVEANNAFDRFLKLYHCLELIFDYVIFKRTQKLGDDMRGYAKLTSRAGGKEIDRLKFLIEEYCDDPKLILERMCLITSFEHKAREIFQDHSKDQNPFGDDSQWEKFLNLLKAGQVTESDLKRSKLSTDSSSYKKLVVRVSAYWIYRIRSSIAHSRIGEFLFEESDEKMISDFCEPMILEVVAQVFSSVELSELAV